MNESLEQELDKAKAETAAAVRKCEEICREYGCGRIKRSVDATDQTSRDAQLHKAVTADTLAEAIRAAFPEYFKEPK